MDAPERIWFDPRCPSWEAISDKPDKYYNVEYMRTTLFKKMSTEISDLKAALEAEMNSNHRLTARELEQSNQIADLKKELSWATDRAWKFENELDVKDKQIADLKAEVEQLKRELDAESSRRYTAENGEPA